MTGRDNIDSASEAVALLRRENAEMRALLERLPEPAARIFQNDGDVMTLDYEAAKTLAAVARDTRLFLAAPLPEGAAPEPVFGVGDTVRAIGDSMKMVHGMTGREGVVHDIVTSEVLEVAEGPRHWFVHPRDLVLVRKTGGQ